jgi:large subunit ribosomal protein L28
VIIFLRHKVKKFPILSFAPVPARDRFDHDAQASFKILLTNDDAHASLAGFFPTGMSKVCNITGSRAARGSVIHRRGMAKKKGGVGRHVTKNVPRVFAPNLHQHRIWVPELKKFVRIRVSARGLKTINKNGAYAALKKAGAI